jgi:hypothetical protein
MNSRKNALKTESQKLTMNEIPKKHFKYHKTYMKTKSENQVKGKVKAKIITKQ